MHQLLVVYPPARVHKCSTAYHVIVVQCGNQLPSCAFTQAKNGKGREPSTVNSVWLVSACGAIARAARALLARPFEDDHDHMLELNLVCVNTKEHP
jgi:hypothetical protein